ncbi:NADPH-dependent FMN reductase [Allgaiera indica]|uniref:NADPH-dependent FMN reductase n=1 Tax=Allgaiera indica TaxID=765699 RepID=UPI00244EE7D7|nr:NAD(P)H-dependent oxidoreductase [Allgaiera indica]
MPEAVRNFAGMVRDCDGVSASSPEYVRAIPGGLKNAIDWLVSRDELIGKPIAKLHASHRGGDMLGQLRQVLATVSQRFSEDPFLRFDLMKMSPDGIMHHFEAPEHRLAVKDFLDRLAARCG